MKRRFLNVTAASAFFLLGIDAAAPQQPAPINGLVYLINTDAEAEIDGLLKWGQELKSRGLTAMIKASNPVLETYPELFK
jgi:hypothetical protein